ncbi:MAG TPA: EpsG family protein [Methylomusa anaerophila]|uniref:Transmembrane protein EpsG n=1 Tax=Methylomusa anaerophila TaxID=1930071 RepID=A0A348AGC2_9FIRM|nr:EpsG family protein [Methylomusa anaerophila]BBB90120.1 transmembrane protein EpsG [Methylomusa anaerophila]HML88156.1 EpsG family protein [Methylomusa anaerophila]
MLSELETIFLYISIIIGATLFALIPTFINSRILKYACLGLSFLVAWIPAAIRYGTGTDYFAYIEKYYEVTFYPQTFLEIIQGREPVFNLLNFLVKWNFNDPQYIFVISSFLLLIFIYRMVEDQSKKINMGLAVFIFMTLFYFASYNILRQYLAMGLVFYSYKYLVEKDFFKFAFLVATASLFHLTALIILPMYFLTGKYRKILLAVYIGAILMIMSFYSVFLQSVTSFEIFERYSVYTPDTDRLLGLGQIIMRLPILLPLLFYSKRIIALNKGYEAYFNFIIIDPFLGVLTYITPNANRIAFYFSLAYILLLSVFPRIFKRPYSYYAYAYVIFYCFAYWILFYIVRGVNNTVPYQFTWFIW